MTNNSVILGFKIKIKEMQKNHELELAFDFVQYTNRNIFLTGKAGTGKTTFLRSLKTKLSKRMVVVAPTGVAAINAGGVTIHSFFQLPFGPIVTERVAGHKIDNPNFKKKFAKKKINIIKTLDLLIIDEISMVRADMLDAIDEVLRRYKNRLLPFGGVQLLMIGDLQQLAPVVKDDEWQLMRQYYNSMYFFNSHAIRDSNMTTVELKHIYRQKDDKFVKILNEVRNDELSAESYDILHTRYKDNFRPKEEEGYITLTTHNRNADVINQERMKEIKGKSRKFKAEVDGLFSESSYPTEFHLELKLGAQVMYVKNDSNPEKRYFNGKIGKVISFGDGEILIEADGEEILTTPEVWENIKYEIDPQTKEIKEEVIGKFIQFPLRLAWAITIHKSQGLTFDKAIIDAAAAFSHGQTYVAFSRCRTLEGMVLSSKISESAIICDREVTDFNKTVEENQPTDQQLETAKNTYQRELISEIFNYQEMSYTIGRLNRVIGEHLNAISGNINDTVNNLQRKALPEISGVAVNFMKQVNYLLLQNADIENNEELQERIKKAADYFYNYHENIILAALKETTYDTDSKATSSGIDENLDKLSEILNIKQKSLKILIHGFNIEAYLSVRAKSALDNNKSDVKKAKKVITKGIRTKYSDLYALLKFWRSEEAEADGVELYQIAPNKVLEGIANDLPCTKKQMLAISGIGKVKFEQYGDVWLEMVEEFIEESGLERTPDSAELDMVIEKKSKKNSKSSARKERSWEVTYQLYKRGRTIEQIANERGFVESTIEGHLTKYIEKGEIDIKDFVKDDKIKKIMKYYKKNPEANSTDAIAELGKDFNYSNIRMVKSYMNYLEEGRKG